jgi:pimeloyl-ACP methyl ester carboxylesterase
MKGEEWLSRSMPWKSKRFLEDKLKMYKKTCFRSVFPSRYVVAPFLLFFIFAGMLQASDSVTKPVNFSSGGINLSGELTLPSEKGSFPGIVLISGSGPHDRDGFVKSIPGYRPFAVIAEHLAEKGYAVLCYDDRGVGESTGDYASAVEDDFISDAESAVRFLLSQKEINSRNIGVLGHSEGALIAAQVASQMPEVAFVISLAGGAVDGKSLLLQQALRQAEAEGMSSEEVDRVLEEQSLIFDLASAKDWRQLTEVLTQSILKRLESLPSEKTARIGELKVFAQKRAEQSVNTFKHPRYQYLLNHDFAADWEKVSVPVLALYGELDVQCDADQNMAAMQRIFVKSGNTDLTIKLIPGANHLFVKAETGSMREYQSLSKDFAPGFLDLISEWLNKQSNRY